jgi:mannose-6-phosphate isomerase-like protein (cupin superfamily)
MAKPIRRLVTGHDAAGKAVCVSDALATNVLERPARPGVALTNLWRTETVPAPIDGPAETVDGPLVLHPPAGGTIFRIVEFQPEDPARLATLDGRAAFGDMGAAEAIVAGARHPFMHRTETVDYAVILDGEIWLMLDDTEYLMRAGDTVVQRGTNHAWSNRGTEPCRIAFILVDGARG